MKIDGVEMTKMETRSKMFRKCQQLAAEKGGSLESLTYLNAHKKLSWKCVNDHTFSASPSNVLYGKRWCPICAGRILTTEESVKQEVAKKNGTIKSIPLKGLKSTSHVEVVCQHGHLFSIRIGHLRAGHWCSRCGGSHPLRIEDMRSRAQERGGLCLSKKYISIKSKLLWECKFQHRFKATGNQVSSGKWCPTCSAGIGERICKEHFEQIFRKPFPKARPAWLLSENGIPMELDGFCEELGIAFEHHGEHHYEINWISASRKKKHWRQSRDKFKKEICAQHDVALIEIPELFSRTKVSELKSFILKACASAGVSIPRKVPIEINLLRAYSFNPIHALREIARQRGGKCLSKDYLGPHEKLHWKCKAPRHPSWMASPNSVKRGHWCKKCSIENQMEIRARRGILEFKEKVESHGGKLHSTEFKNSSSKLLVQCRNKHKWSTTLTSLKQSHWCKICAQTQRRNKEKKSK